MRTRLVALALIVLGLFSYLSLSIYLSVSSDTRSVSILDSDSSYRNSSSSSSVLLVSALYPLEKSKHSSVEYARWLSHFLGSLSTDVYFFTTLDVEPLVRDVLSLNSFSILVTINTTYASPFDVPPLGRLRESYERMQVLDRERHRHSPELYAVWNAKPFFLSEGLRNARLASSGAADYDFAFWCDAGSFRSEHVYRMWPDPERVEEVWGKAMASGGNGSELFFVPMAGVPEVDVRTWKAEMGPVDWDFSQGSFFGGKQPAIEWWRRVFYAYHDAYLESGMFVGKDQTVMNAILIVHAERVVTVWHGDPEAPAHVGMPEGKRMLGECGDAGGWFYYQWWLAGKGERRRMSEIWERRIWAKMWWWMWGVWERRGMRGGVVERCRETRVLMIEEVLRRRFGEGWEPPKGLIY